MGSQGKIGFWTLTSLVAGSQIGTGIFLLPASLVVFGGVGLCSWCITASGALLLAFVFARLASLSAKTGGPHTFIEQAFGRSLGFFSAWTYWVISWVSTSVVIVSIVSYLTPLLGHSSPLMNLGFELFFLGLMTYLNLSGIRSAGVMEIIFTLLKLLPLFLVPVAGLFFFQSSHFVPFNPTPHTTLHVLNAAALLTLWGFIGVESATAPGESVHNPNKTIPRALILGTLLVAIVYIFSSTMIMGVVPPQMLAQSSAPFADAAQIIFGGNWHLLISLCASFVCLGTLNAWILTSGQIALGAARDGHFPQIFSVKNSKGAPIWGLVMSSLGMVPVLVAMLSDNLIQHINWIIELSVTAFLLIYLLSVLSYIKLFWKNGALSLGGKCVGLGALIFCGWTLYASGALMIACTCLFPLSGLPIYMWQKRKRHQIIV